MDNCACAWAQVFPEYPRFRVYHHIRQTAWCRLHMEAEIAKQGQAAGAVASTANPNVDGAQTGKPDAKKAGLA